MFFIEIVLFYFSCIVFTIKINNVDYNGLGNNTGDNPTNTYDVLTAKKIIKLIEKVMIDGEPPTYYAP
mgnify:CR=1 FL=1